MKKTSLMMVLGLAFSHQAFADDLLLLLQGKENEAGAVVYNQQKFNLQALLKEVQPQFTAEQNIFANFFNQGNMEKSLFYWQAAFGGHAFADTAAGKALYSYLLFQNRLQVVGLESLFAIENPEKIPSGLLALWKEAAPSSHPIWGLAQVVWKPAWTDVFGTSAEVMVMSRQNFQMDDVEKIKTLLAKSAPDTKERGLLEWQLVLALSMKDEAQQAAKVLAHLVKAEKNPISLDLLNMTAARLLYQNGYLDAAIQYYQKVGKASDYWFDSQEESAWSYIRKGEPQNTLAVTKTLANPLFSEQIGPETLFLRAMAQLKVCDYPAVVASLNDFRSRFKPRAQALMQLEQDPANVNVQKYIKLAQNKTPSLKEVGPDLKLLPRYITRDARLNDLLRLRQQLESESKAAVQLYSRSLTETGLQKKFEEFKNASEQRNHAAESAVYQRVKSLAAAELRDIERTLQKMQIVEAEVLQQISVSNKLVKTDIDKIIEKKGSTGSQSKDKLVFAADGETWFDELSNYKVDVKKACQKVN